jgi:hypothetical protein
MRQATRRPSAPNLLACPVHMTLRRSFLPAVMLVAVLAGCQPSAEALPRLSDPTEILEEAIRTTAELEFVHARLEAATDAGGGAQQYTVDGDIDLAQREFHALAELGAGGMSQKAELLLAGTDLFIRLQDGGLGGLGGSVADDRWQRQPLGGGNDPRNGLPATPAIAVALKALLSDPGITSELEGMTTCGDRQCYHLTIRVDPEVTWRAVNGGLIGGAPANEIGPPDPAIPEVVFDVKVDESTRNLVSVATSIAAQGQTVDLAATLSNHGVEFELLPPNPDEVVESDLGGEFAPAPGVIEEFGPTPAPME